MKKLDMKLKFKLEMPKKVSKHTKWNQMKVWLMFAKLPKISKVKLTKPPKIVKPPKITSPVKLSKLGKQVKW